MEEKRRHDQGFTTVEVLVALFIGLVAFIPLADAAHRSLQASQRMLERSQAIIESRNTEADAYAKLFSF
jgi:Tfp pilus assembly protein PilV